MRRIFFPLALITVLLLSGCYSRGTRPPRIGMNAPDFTVKDDERSITLRDYRGQVVVLNFWASWCPPCIQETPSLVQMQTRMKDKGVIVLAVSEDADEAAYHRFLQRFNSNLVSVRDPSAKTKTLYGTVLIPETFIIDRQGVVRRKFISAVDWNSPEITDFLTKL